MMPAFSIFTVMMRTNIETVDMYIGVVCTVEIATAWTQHNKCTTLPGAFWARFSKVKFWNFKFSTNFVEQTLGVPIAKNLEEREEKIVSCLPALTLAHSPLHKYNTQCVVLATFRNLGGYISAEKQTNGAERG